MSNRKEGCHSIGKSLPCFARENLVRFEYTSVDNELPKFCGSQLELVGWLNIIESVFGYCHVTKEKKVKWASTCLKGRALDW